MAIYHDIFTFVLFMLEYFWSSYNNFCVIETVKWKVNSILGKL